MEMRATQHIKRALMRWLCMALMTVANLPAQSQPIRGYTIKDGKMFITLDRKISDVELNEFIKQYDLDGIGLWQLVKTRKHDSLEKEGWQVMVHNEVGFMISKKLEGLNNFEFPADKINWNQDKNDFLGRFPSVSSKWVY